MPPSRAGPPAATVRRRANRISLRRRDGLIRHARDATSQNGEDGVIARLFNDLLPPAPWRHCVDVGAWDGVHLSNTHSLLVRRGGRGDCAAEWRGVLIEADPRRFQELRRLHEPLGNVCIGECVSCDGASSRSLLSILRRDAPHLPDDFDFLSIDVDGTDYHILANVLGANQGGEVLIGDNRTKRHGYQPKVICVEFNPTMPIDLIYIQPCDDNVRHGSSLSALVELANASDYVLIETTVFNAFFARRDLYERHLRDEVPDTSIEALHEVTMGTELYQLYDGTIKLAGCRKMLWHRRPIDEEAMQVLPEEERGFPFAPDGSRGRDEHETEKQPSPGDAHARDTQSKGAHLREMAIDMSPYCSGDETSDDLAASSRRACAAELQKALQTRGFALVRGTGLRGGTCDDALRSAKAFLHDAEEAVRRSCLTKDRARRGYSPMCTENFASLVGERGPNDLVKKFRVGPVSESMTEAEGGRSQNCSQSSLHQPNAWPTEEVWGRESASHFRSSITRYFESVRHAADCILKAICDGLIAEDGDVSASIKALSESTSSRSGAAADENETPHHTSILTLLGYQPGSRHKRGSKGYLRPLVSAHTDVGVITVLLFDRGQCAALQRAGGAADPDPREWVDVDLPPARGGDDPVFVVNVGDCLSELSGGSLRSTLHRVVPRPCAGNTSKDDVVRTCLALFVGLEPSASLVFPSSEGEAVSYEEWRRRRIARATAVLKNG